MDHRNNFSIIDTVNSLRTYLLATGIFQENDIDAIMPFVREQQFPKGTFLIEEGDVCGEVAFVVNGIFRTYYTTPQGEEITYCITFPENLITAYSSYITSKPTPENIQALTDTYVMLIPKSHIDDLALHYPSWLTFLKMMAEQQYVELEKRIFQLQRDNARSRYEDMLHNQPQFIKHIPLKHLASYLGITQRHLSRIRKEVAF
jgi:CRP-like cAMP-binding protein